MRLALDPGAPLVLLLLQGEAPGGVKDVGRRQFEMDAGAVTDDGGQDRVLGCKPEDASQAGGGGRRPRPLSTLTFIAESDLNWQLGGSIRTPASCEKHSRILERWFF